MSSAPPDSLAALLRAALEAWDVRGDVLRDGDGALLLSLSPSRAAERGEGRASITSWPGPDPATQGPHSTRVEQAALDGRLKAGHDEERRPQPPGQAAAALRPDHLPARGEREKSIRIACAPAGLPFRFALEVGGRERMATGVAGVLRLVRAAIDPDYEAQRLRVGRQPAVTA